MRPTTRKTTTRLENEAVQDCGVRPERVHGPPTESVLAVVDAADEAAASQKARVMFPNRECKIVGVLRENV